MNTLRSATGSRKVGKSAARPLSTRAQSSPTTRGAKPAKSIAGKSAQRKLTGKKTSRQQNLTPPTTEEIAEREAVARALFNPAAAAAAHAAYLARQSSEPRHAK